MIKHIERKEGDVWEQDNKTWTIRNGIKRTTSILDQARTNNLTPLSCPKCGGSMKGSMDELMWTLDRTCFNCVVDKEHTLRMNGTWDAYEKHKVLANAIAFQGEMIAALSEFANQKEAQSHVTEDGLIERWQNPNKEAVQQLVDEELDQLQKMIEDYQKTPLPPGLGA